MSDKVNDIKTRTTLEEKVKRFDFINGQFMSKYLDLIWFARANPDQLVENEEYEVAQKVVKSLQEMVDKYPIETQELFDDDSNWQHGFNSGVLAYARFLSSYCEDGLWEVCEENKDMIEYEEVITINGVDYIEFDGRQDAFDSFPELYT